MIALETALARGAVDSVENRDPVKTYNKVETSASCATLGPGLRLASVARGDRRSPAGRPTSIVQPAELLRRAFARAHGDAAAGLEGVPAVRTCSMRTRRISARPSSTRASRSTARRWRAVTENQPRWKRGVALVDSAHGRGARQALRRGVLPAGAKARMERWSTTCSPRTARASTTLDWMSAGDQEARRRPSSPSSRRRSATRTSGATTRRSRSRKDDLVGNVDARARVRVRSATSTSSASRSIATSGA